MRTIASITLRMTVGLAVGALLLFLTLRNVNIDEVRETLRLIDGRWVILAIASSAVALFVRTIRWLAYSARCGKHQARPSRPGSAPALCGKCIAPGAARRDLSRRLLRPPLADFP